MLDNEVVRNFNKVNVFLDASGGKRIKHERLNEIIKDTKENWN